MTGSRPGPVEALRRVAGRSLALLLSRAEFATLELTEARARLMRWLLFALVGAAVLQLALLAVAAAVTTALWDRFGPLTLVALALLFAAVGGMVLARLRREIAATPPLLSETLTELGKDRDAVFGTAPPDRAGEEPREDRREREGGA